MKDPDTLIYTSDAAFENDVFGRQSTPVLVDFLGRVVRPLQGDRANPRRTRAPLYEGQDSHRQIEHR